MLLKYKKIKIKICLSIPYKLKKSFKRKGPHHEI